MRVSTQTETLEGVLSVDLSETEVEVLRNRRRIDTVPVVVSDGDLTIVPVVEERLVVTRVLYQREEVHIRRTQQQERTEIPVNTRRQTVRVGRLPRTGAPITTNSNAKDDPNDL